MSYAELVQRALKGRSVNQAAKEWHMQQVTLNRYVKGQRLPGYKLALLMAKEAGISEAEAMRTLAEEEEKMRSKTEKISEGFKALLHTAKRYWARVPATVQ